MDKFDDPDSPNNIIYEGSSIHAATLHKLIEKITAPTDVGVDFLHDFLTTYRAFTTPDLLLQLLLDRFRTAGSTALIRLRVFNCLRLWLDKYWPDFEKDLVLLQERVSAFLDSIEMNDPQHNMAKTVKAIFERQLAGKEQKIISSEPPTYISKEKDTLFDIKSLEIARQFTLIEWNIWKQIQPWELLKLAWKTDNDMSTSKVLELLQRYSYVSGWIATLICNAEKSKERVKIIEKFIDIAQELRKIGNFNGVVEIMAGLSCEPVKRLSHTRGFIQEKHKTQYKTWQDLNTLVDPNNNHENLRNVLKETAHPCLPYLGIFLCELNILEEKSPDMIPGTNLINFIKQREVAEILKMIKLYQQKPFIFGEVQSILSKLDGEPLNTLEELTHLSHWCEPPLGTEKGEKPIFEKKSIKPKASSGDFDLAVVKEWSPFYVIDSPTNLVMETEEVIKSGTLFKIVERLTHHVKPDTLSLPGFMATFRSFTKASELLNILWIRYKFMPDPKSKNIAVIHAFKEKMKIPICERIYHVLKYWIVYYWYDFVDDEELKRKLVMFIETPTGDPPFNISLPLLKTNITKQEEVYQHICNLTKENVSETIYKEDTTCLSFPPLSLSEQLTLSSWRIFISIRPEEIFVGTQETPHLKKFLAHSVAVERWLMRDIRICSEMGRELQILNYLIEMLQFCKTLNNWHCIQAIMNSLAKTTNTMKTAWEFVPEINQQIYKEIQLEFQNVEELQNLQMKMLPPCVPDIKVFLHKIIQIGSLFPVNLILENYDQIDMAKQRALGEVVLQFIKLQQPYELLSQSPDQQAYLKQRLEEAEPPPDDIPSSSLPTTSSAEWALNQSSELVKNRSRNYTENLKIKRAIIETLKKDMEFRKFISKMVRDAISDDMLELNSELKELITTSLNNTSPVSNSNPVSNHSSLSIMSHNPTITTLQNTPSKARPRSVVFPKFLQHAVYKITQGQDDRESSRKSALISESGMENSGMTLSGVYGTGISGSTSSVCSNLNVSTDNDFMDFIHDITMDDNQSELTLEQAEVRSHIAKIFPNCLPRKWLYNDTTGIFGKPDILFVHVVVHRKVDFLLHVSTQVDEGQVAKVIQLGSIYRKQKFYAPLCCVIFCKKITPEAQSQCVIMKIKVYVV